jgi:hypothetical protein
MYINISATLDYSTLQEHKLAAVSKDISCAHQTPPPVLLHNA